MIIPIFGIDMMKKIALIYMGGTFGCIGDPLSPMPAGQLQALLRAAFQVAA